MGKMNHQRMRYLVMRNFSPPKLSDLCCMMINIGELVEMCDVDVGDFVGMFSQSFVLLSVV